jgi:hypothetical protein
MHKLVHLHRILIHKFQDNSLLNKHISGWVSEDFHNQMVRTRRCFDRFIEHPLIIKLTLLVFIFTINLSNRSDSRHLAEYKNPKKLYELQNYYTTVLWRYLNHVFEEKEAIHALEIIVMQISRYQELMITIETQVRHEPHKNILHALMQSILGLS